MRKKITIEVYSDSEKKFVHYMDVWLQPGEVIETAVQHCKEMMAAFKITNFNIILPVSATETDFRGT